MHADKLLRNWFTLLNQLMQKHVDTLVPEFDTFSPFLVGPYDFDHLGIRGSYLSSGKYNPLKLIPRWRLGEDMRFFTSTIDMSDHFLLYLPARNVFFSVYNYYSDLIVVHKSWLYHTFWNMWPTDVYCRGLKFRTLPLGHPTGTGFKPGSWLSRDEHATSRPGHSSYVIAPIDRDMFAHNAIWPW